MDRPSPLARGDLQRTPFAHLLVYVEDKRLTGSLELSTPSGATAAVTLVDGQTTKARSTEPVALLGAVLVEHGVLAESAVATAVSQARGRKMPLGAYLVDAGLVARPALDEALREQLARTLRHMFALPRATTYAFYDHFDVLHEAGDDAPPADPWPVLWSSILEAPPVDHLQTTLAQAKERWFRLVPQARVERFRFPKALGEPLRSLRERPTRYADLLTFPNVDVRHAEALLYCLLITKQVQAVVPAGARASMPAPSPTSPVPTSPVPASPVPASPARASGVASGIHGPPSAASTVTPEPDLPPELKTRWREITERAATIDKQDYFEMLGLPRDATAAQVQAAFYALAKVWHPDRLLPELEPVKSECARVFARLGEAHQTLTDEERRQRYMKLLVDGGATPEAQETIAQVVEASTNFQKAEVFVKKNDLAKAETLCRKAWEADKQADYLALLAWLESLKPENQTSQATLDRIAMLDRAIQMNERCERAFFYRGMLHKRLQNLSSAIRDFRRAAELNPRNLDAIREVRLYELRRSRGTSLPPPAAASTPPPASKPGASKPATSDAKPGLFGRWFKKG